MKENIFLLEIKIAEATLLFIPKYSEGNDRIEFCLFGIEFNNQLVLNPLIQLIYSNNYLRLAWDGKEDQIPTWEKISQVKLLASAEENKDNLFKRFWNFIKGLFGKNEPLVTIDKIKIEIPSFLSDLRNEEIRIIGFNQKKKTNTVFALSFDKKNNNRKTIEKEFKVFKKNKNLIPYFFYSYNNGKFLIPKLEIDLEQTLIKMEDNTKVSFSATDYDKIKKYFDQERSKTTSYTLKQEKIKQDIDWNAKLKSYKLIGSSEDESDFIRKYKLPSNIKENIFLLEMKAADVTLIFIPESIDNKDVEFCLFGIEFNNRLVLNPLIKL